MCAGIRDAWNLSWKLDLIPNGAATDKLLDSYTAERKPHVSSIIDASIHLGRIICIADPVEAAERDRAFKTGTAEPPPPFPHLSAGLLARGGLVPLAGLLAPHGIVRWRGREGRWDDVIGGGFCVIMREADGMNLLRADQRLALNRLGTHMVGVAAETNGDCVVDIEGTYSAFLGTHGAAAVITRPDFYVFGGVADRSDLSGLVDEFLAALASNGVEASMSAVVT